MGFQLQITKDALAELEQILEYSLANFPATAEQFGTALLRHLNVLKTFPYIGNPVENRSGVRRIIHTPLRIYYREKIRTSSRSSILCTALEGRIADRVATYRHRLYTCSVAFEWDAKKSQQNIRKHGVRFTEAIDVLSDEMALTTEQEIDGEQRFITVGIDGRGHVLAVAFTYRGENIRIISARRATSNETEQYMGSK